MKLLLYDNEKMELPNLRTFDERVKYIDKHIFNDYKYKRYYNIYATDLTTSEIKTIEKWWLGVRKVNQPNPIEKLKTTLDILTGYILGVKDFSVNHLLNKYKELKKKYKNNDLSKSEKQDYYKLRDRVLYEDKDIIFLNNIEMENQLEKTLSLLILKQYKNYTDEFMIKDIRKRLDQCSKIKDDVAELKEIISNLFNEKSDIKNTIQQEFELFQIDKNEESLDSIVRMANKIKQINDNVRYNKIKVKELHQDYLLCTEFFYKTK